jgi:hypothetical protein
MRRVLGLVALCWLTACGGPVRNQEVDGPYRIIAADDPEERHLSYDLGTGNAIGRVRSTVVGVGYDERYITVVRRPRDQPSVTEFYYLIRAFDGPDAAPSNAIRGPFDQAGYEAEAARLNLPETEPVS